MLPLALSWWRGVDLNQRPPGFRTEIGVSWPWLSLLDCYMTTWLTNESKAGENSCRVHVDVLAYIILFISTFFLLGSRLAEPGPLTL